VSLSASLNSLTMPTMRALRRPLLSLTALLVAGCTAFQSLTSTTTIDPGKAFRLGGGQQGAFVVRGVNSGSVPVIVYQERDGKRDSLGVVPPRGEIDAEFSSRSMAIFRNLSLTQQATVSIKVTGDVSSLGMGYEVTPTP